MAEEKQTICDVCDAEIPVDSKKCPVCGAELNEEKKESEDEESLDDVMEYIIGEEDDEEILDKIKSIGSTTDESEEESFLEEDILEEEIIEERAGEEIEEYKEEEIEFECPVCGTIVSAEDSKCPNCGAIFETDEEEIETEKVDELEDGIDYVEEELERLEDSKIDLTYLNNGLNDLIDSYEESRYEEGVEILEVLETQIEDIKEIIRLTEISKDHLDFISDKTDITAFEKRLDNLIDKAEVGEYKQSLKEAKELNQDLEKIKSEYEEEEETLRNDLESEMSKAKERLSEVRGKKINISDIKEHMKNAVAAKKGNEYSEGIENAKEVVEKSEYVLTIIDLIDKGKNKIKELKNKGISYDTYLEKLKEGKSQADDSSYELSIDTLEDVLDDLEKELEKPEEEEMEVREPEKEEVEEKVEEAPEELDDLLDEAKKNLAKVRKTKISVSLVKDSFKDAFQAKKNKDFDLAIEKARDANEKAEDIFEISDLIDDAKSKIKTLKEKEAEYKGFLNKLKSAKGTADEGKYEKCIDETEDLIDELDEIIMEMEEKEKEKEEKSKLIEEIDELAAEVDSLSDEANKLDADVEIAINLKEEALDKRDEGDLEWSIRKLEKSVEIIHESIEDSVEEELMELELNLEESWDQDARKSAENLIAEIRDCIERRNYEDIPELINEAKEKTEEALGPISKLEEEISNTEDLVFEVKILEYDVSDAEEKLKNAKEELELGDWDESERYLESAKKEISDRLPELLKSNIKESRDELRQAKIKGIDISGAVSALKDVKVAQKEGKLIMAFEKYQEFKEKMEDIRKQ